jgi:hypothetical protein
MKSIALIIFVVFILVGGYFLISRNKSSSPAVNTNSPATIKNSTPQPTIDNNDLRAGGSSYRDPQGVYVFLYPAEYKLDTQDKQHARIYKIGTTQKGQTEIYDGVIVVFEAVNLEGQTLSNWVDNYLRTATTDGALDIVEPKKATTQNNYSGFTYSIRGQGIAKYYVLQKDSKSNYAVIVTTSVNDPQNAGFQKEVDKILSTLEILK